MALNGKAVAALGAGSLFAWSGIKGWSILGSAGDLITGVQPSGTNEYPLGGHSSSGGGSSFTGGGDYVSIGMQYIGHAYLFGGAPGRDGSKPWDCSSMWDWIIGVKMGRPIPGNGVGSYNGTTHGPATGSWAIWPGLAKGDRNNIQPGDFIIWAGHMGVCVAPNKMLSALNQSKKTEVTPINGYGNGPLLRVGPLK
jgi:hypothetical protein